MTHFQVTIMLRVMAKWFVNFSTPVPLGIEEPRVARRTSVLSADFFDVLPSTAFHVVVGINLDSYKWYKHCSSHHSSHCSHSLFVYLCVGIVCGKDFTCCPTSMLVTTFYDVRFTRITAYMRTNLYYCCC